MAEESAAKGKNDPHILKTAVARELLAFIPDHSTVGLGSGSTAARAIELLGDELAAGRKKNIVGVPTSWQSRWLAMQRGIPIRDSSDLSSLDMAFDGADQVDPDGYAIKGAGGAAVVEKVIATMARSYYLLIEQHKLVGNLGDPQPVPVEVLADAMGLTLEQIIKLGGRPAVRTGTGKLGPVISDLGHIIVDVRFGQITDPLKLDRELKLLPGVIGHGLFTRIPDRVFIGRHTPRGVEVEHLTQQPEA